MVYVPQDSELVLMKMFLGNSHLPLTSYIGIWLGGQNRSFLLRTLKLYVQFLFLGHDKVGVCMGIAVANSRKELLHIMRMLYIPSLSCGVLNFEVEDLPVCQTCTGLISTICVDDMPAKEDLAFGKATAALLSSKTRFSSFSSSSPRVWPILGLLPHFGLVKRFTNDVVCFSFKHDHDYSIQPWSN